MSRIQRITPLSSFTRRAFIRTGTSATLVTAAGGSLAPAVVAGGARPSLITRENAREGTAGWQLTRVRPAQRDGVRAPDFEGYCSRQSVLAGELLDIMVSAKPAARFKIEIFRTGDYGGRGARLMTVLGPFNGKTQPDPPIGGMRLRECRWEASATVRIPADWPSGVYLGRLNTISESAAQPYWQNYVVLIVRDTRRAGVLVQCSDNTWQAYNQWPDKNSLDTDPRGAVALDFHDLSGTQGKFCPSPARELPPGFAAAAGGGAGRTDERVPAQGLDLRGRRVHAVHRPLARTGGPGHHRP